VIVCDFLPSTATAQFSELSDDLVAKCVGYLHVRNWPRVGTNSKLGARALRLAFVEQARRAG
jgi:hypothetical protein|tara:strand:+ start:33 stop:218 length:186 start_codon:yes stop_codon:yes gene_type:complete